MTRKHLGISKVVFTFPHIILGLGVGVDADFGASHPFAITVNREG